MLSNRSAPTATVVPVLIYDDVGQAIDWLCDAFGFTERLRAAKDHGQIAIGEGAAMLGARRVGQGFDSLTTPSSAHPVQTR